MQLHLIVHQKGSSSFSEFLSFFGILALACFFAAPTEACSTAVNSCGSLCLCKDVTSRWDSELEPCQFCMSDAEQGCFCPEGQAWLDDKRLECISFQECRDRTPGSTPVEMLPHRELPSAPIERLSDGDEDTLPPGAGAISSDHYLPIYEEEPESNEANEEIDRLSEYDSISSNTDYGHAANEDAIDAVEEFSTDAPATDLTTPDGGAEAHKDVTENIISEGVTPDGGHDETMDFSESNSKPLDNEPSDIESESVPDESAVVDRNGNVDSAEKQKQRSTAEWFDKWFAGGGGKRKKRTHLKEFVERKVTKNN